MKQRECTLRKTEKGELLCSICAVGVDVIGFLFLVALLWLYMIATPDQMSAECEYEYWLMEQEAARTPASGESDFQAGVVVGKSVPPLTDNMKGENHDGRRQEQDNKSRLHHHRTNVRGYEEAG